MRKADQWDRDGGSSQLTKLAVDIFEAKPLRCSSYIETPEKCSNSKFGLISIKRKDDESFKWYMRYHQSDEAKNTVRVAALKKIKDTYTYDGMVFPADNTRIEAFEELHKVRIFIYEIDEEGKV